MLRREFLQCVAAFAASAAAVRAAANTTAALPALERQMTAAAEGVLAAIRDHELRPVGLLRAVRNPRRFSIVYVAGEPRNRLSSWEIDQMIRHYRLIADRKARVADIEVINRGCGCRIDFEVSA